METRIGVDSNKNGGGLSFSSTMVSEKNGEDSAVYLDDKNRSLDNSGSVDYLHAEGKTVQTLLFLRVRKMVKILKFVWIIRICLLIIMVLLILFMQKRQWV